MDFKTLNGVRELKRFCMICIEYGTDFQIFFLVNFVFSLNFFFYFDFQMHETHLKSFVYEISILEIIVRPFISLMTKFEVYTVCSF